MAVGSNRLVFRVQIDFLAVTGPRVRRQESRSAEYLSALSREAVVRRFRGGILQEVG